MKTKNLFLTIVTLFFAAFMLASCSKKDDKKDIGKNYSIVTDAQFLKYFTVSATSALEGTSIYVASKSGKTITDMNDVVGIVIEDSTAKTFFQKDASGKFFFLMPAANVKLIMWD